MTENKRLKILVVVMGAVIVASVAFLAGFTVAERQSNDKLDEAVAAVQQQYDNFRADSERQLEQLQAELSDKVTELETALSNSNITPPTTPTGHNDAGMEYPIPE